MKLHTIRALLLALAAMFVVPAALAQAAPAAPAANKVSAAETRTAMRKLWEDHITYTRNFIVSSLGGLGDADAVANRLMKNQDEIGNAIKPFYGDAAGNQMAKLLREHISQAAAVVTAAKGGDKAKLAAEQAKWTQNGKDIAAFLAGANPNWNKADLESMMQKHLDLTTAEVVARLKKDWAADIRAYDEGHHHMLMFSDALTDGIAKQFPNRFQK